MERRGKSPARDFARAAESGTAACGLSGMARGGEWQGRDTAARGDKRRDDFVAFRWNGADYGSPCAYSGPESGDFDLPVLCAHVVGALKRRRIAATLG